MNKELKEQVDIIVKEHSFLKDMIKLIVFLLVVQIGFMGVCFFVLRKPSIENLDDRTVLLTNVMKNLREIRRDFREVNDVQSEKEGCVDQKGFGDGKLNPADKNIYELQHLVVLRFLLVHDEQKLLIKIVILIVD